MAEIRNLTRNGETFYPLTHVEGVLDPEGEYIGNYVENPEFVYVKTDNGGKILYGVKTDGEFFFGARCPQQVKDYIEEKIQSLSLDEYEDMVAFLNGLEEGDKTLQTLLNEKVDKVEGKSLIDAEYASSQSAIENPEFIEAKTDSEGKLLAGRTLDGAAFEKVGFTTTKVSIDGNIIKSIEDPEGRSEITTDKDSKVLSYRDNQGVLHEIIGIDTKSLSINGIKVSNKLINEQDNLIYKEDFDSSKIRKFTLPDFGYVDILSEKFYLESHEGVSSKNDVVPLYIMPNTQENAKLLLTTARYFIKTTVRNNGDGTYSRYEDGVEGHDVSLDFYPAGDVTKIDSKYYATNSLTEVINPETGKSHYEVNENSVETTEITDVPFIDTWPVSKENKHHCIVNIDFGEWLSGTFNIEVKYQGSATLANIKRNFRFTFYKNASFEKKMKIKLGELIRQTGFNLKANYGDPSRIKEFVMYRLILSIWEQKNEREQYPWSNKEDVSVYSGATGNILGFPVEVRIGGEFYGLDIFGLKKDKGNYLIEDDTKGIFVSAEAGAWSNADASLWENEIEDEMPQDTADALNNFFEFIRGNNFTRETTQERMYLRPWIDYFICLQVFFMIDNIGRNMILYSNEEKYKFAPFFYDLDASMQTGFGADVDFFTAPWPQGEYEHDFLVYDRLKELYWDEISNRYNSLRKTILDIDYIRSVFNKAQEVIPDSVFNAEAEKWNSYKQAWEVKISRSETDKLIGYLDERLKWLDTNYFNK